MNSQICEITERRHSFHRGDFLADVGKQMAVTTKNMPHLNDLLCLHIYIDFFGGVPSIKDPLSDDVNLL